MWCGGNRALPLWFFAEDAWSADYLAELQAVTGLTFDHMSHLLWLVFGTPFRGYNHAAVIVEFHWLSLTERPDKTLVEQVQAFLEECHKQPFRTAVALLPTQVAPIVATVISDVLGVTQGQAPVKCEFRRPVQQPV